MYAKVILGGLPPGEEFENVFPNRIINNGEANRGSLEQTGIDPQGVVPGTDDFYFIGGLIEGGFQFNTKINEQGTGDAKTNTEAKFKDGIKDMVIRAHSIRHNNQDYHTDSERQIILDNFAPFVEKVIVKKGGNVKYDAEWELIESGMQLNIPVKDNFSPEDEIHFEITFSEVMDANQINVKLEKSGHQIDVNQSGWNADYTIWEGDATIPDEEWVVGEVIISISSKDLAGNMLDRMPETIANRESNGSWSGYYEAGMDRNHKIYVGNAPIVISTEPSNGAQDVQVDVSPISIIFSKLMKTNGDAA